MPYEKIEYAFANAPRNLVGKFVVNQGNLNVRLFQSAANAVLNKLLAPFHMAKEPEKLSDFPEAIRSRVGAIFRSFDAVIQGNTPFTAYVDVYEGKPEDSIVITEFAMASSDRDTIYQGITFSDCKCLGHEHHNLCYHRWTWEIIRHYAILLKAHEYLVNTYNSLGMEFHISLYNGDDAERFVDAMMKDEGPSMSPPNSTSH